MALLEELTTLNEQLFSYDINLTDLQHSLLAHLVRQIQGTAQSFDDDCTLFKDICQVYKGNVVILEEPTNFVPVIMTKVMKRLIDGETLDILENQAKVKVGTNKSYKFLVSYSERHFFMSRFCKLQVKNFK